MVRIALVLAGVFTVYTASAQLCVTKPVTDPSVAGRAFEVTFPDGHSDIVVGRTHGNRANLKAISDLINGPGSQLPDARFRQQLEAIRAATLLKLPETGMNAQTSMENDITYLGKLLRVRPEFRTIADEGTAEIIETNDKNLPSFFRSYAEELRSRGLPFGAPEVRMAGAAISLVGPVTRQRYPDLSRALRVTGFEDSQAGLAETRQEQVCLDAQARLYKSLTTEEKAQPLWKDFIELPNKLTDLYMGGTFELDTFRAKVLEAIDAQFPANHRALAETFTNECFDHSDREKARDAAVARALAAHPKSVVLFEGQLHLISTVTRLESDCRSRMASIPTYGVEKAVPASTGQR